MRNRSKHLGLRLLVPALAFVIGLASCSEKDEADEYDNWAARNAAYVDSIASLARTQTEGWHRIVPYNLSEEGGRELPNHQYIYTQVIESGDPAGERPYFKDTVRAHYVGRLIPSASHSAGFTFTDSYSTETLNEATDVPGILSVFARTDGLATALMHMRPGDRWKVVIPYYEGYGDTENVPLKVPAYSTLIFDIKLMKIYRFGSNNNSTWH